MTLIEGWSDRGDVGIAVAWESVLVWGSKSFGLRIWYGVTTAKDDVQEVQLQNIERLHEGTNKPALAVICFFLSMTRRGEVVGFGVRGGWFGCSASIRLGDRVVPQASSF
jgi:hypothetical protein